MRTTLVLLALFATSAVAQDASIDGAGESAAPASAQAASTASTVSAASTAAVAAAATATQSPEGVKSMSGMSILGNEEAPKALVIVPWKSSRLGDGLGVTNALDQRPRPLDREVFMRELRYYELRSGGQ
jgi:hypothetical protein